MPIYSFGIDSPLKFELDEEFASLYNRATKAFFKAQSRYKKKHGIPWEPGQLLSLNMSQKEIDAFNLFGHILDEAQDRHGKPVSDDELTSDYLVLNK